MTQKSLLEIATQFVENCKNGNEAEGLAILYAANASSIEAMPMQENGSAEVVGLDAIRAKHAWWDETMEVNNSNTEGPFCHGDDRFGVIFEMDATNKETKERMVFKELAFYTVENGKIIREEFFYTM